MEERFKVIKDDNKVIKETNIQMDECYVNLKHQQNVLIRKLPEYYRIYLTVKNQNEFNKYCELLKKYTKRQYIIKYEEFYKYLQPEFASEDDDEYNEFLISN